MRRNQKNFSAEILTVGDELLKGRTLNTNACYLGQALTSLGFSVERQSSCADSSSAIRERLAEALCRSDLVVVSGGLGPTPDDVTRESLADYFKVPLKFSPGQYRRIVRIYRLRGRKVPACVRREALFPANARPLVNRYGIALGFEIRTGQRRIIVLPGVPSELEKMFERIVRPRLLKNFPGLRKIFGVTVQMTGISEPEVMERLGRDFFHEPFSFGIYPHAGEVTIRIQTRTAASAARVRKKIDTRLEDFIFSRGEGSLAETVGRILVRMRASLSIAESCTGGAVAEAVTRAAGASRYFKGGVTAYANEIKKDFLGVPAVVLRRYGAVSRETALAMAAGVRRRMRTTYGISVTGIAGPSGGSKTKPVGTVFIALASQEKTEAWRHVFGGDRPQIRLRTVKKSLEHLWREIRCAHG